MLLSYTIVEFHYSMMGLLIYTYEPLLQEVSVKLTVKACGPLEKNQRFFNQAHIIGGMGCVSVCNIIPFIARKESLEKVTIVDFFITVILFVNRSC